MRITTAELNKKIENLKWRMGKLEDAMFWSWVIVFVILVFFIVIVGGGIHAVRSGNMDIRNELVRVGSVSYREGYIAASGDVEAAEIQAEDYKKRIRAAMKKEGR